MSQPEMARDIVELLVRRASRFGRWPAIRFHPEGGEEREVSWADWLRDARALANALRALGVRPGDRVALFAQNCPQWLVADIGTLMVGAVSVPISRKAPAAARARMLLELQPKVVFAGNPDDLERLRKNRAGLAKTTQIVLFEAPEDAPDVAPDWGVVGKPVRFADVLVRGHAILKRGDGLKPTSSGRDPDAPATICYSAGRSGPARGAVLSHRALVSKVYALREVAVLPRNATQLLLLPMAGIFGRLMAWAAIDQGATTYIWNRHRDFPDEISAARPHFVAGVPSTFDGLRDLIMSRRDGPMGMPGRATLGLANRFLGGAKRARKGLFGMDRAVARRAFRTRVRHLLGGRMQHMVCGAGLLDESVEALFSFADVPVLNGYGSSETVGVATANRPDQLRPGSVGFPLAGVELRLSPGGEVMLRGEGMFSGYMQPPAHGTGAPDDALVVLPAVDEQGWYRTGDLGLMEDEFLFLTGRKEDIITLSTGRSVAPALIEGAMAASERVAHAVVCGSGCPYVGVLLWRSRHGARAAEAESADEEKKAMQRLVDQTNRGLERHEQVRSYRVLPDQLSVEQGELSANGEPIRTVIYRRYAEAIEQMFRE